MAWETTRGISLPTAIIEASGGSIKQAELPQ